MKLARPTSAAESLIDAVAVHRLTKLLQQDSVWPLPETREALLARWSDRRWADLIDCPYCLSMHLAALVVLARHRWPRGWPWIARVLVGSAMAGHLAELSDR